MDGMFFAIRLGIGDPAQLLSSLLPYHTPQSALTEASMKLDRAAKYLAALVDLGKPIQRALDGTTLYVELDELPPEFKGILEPVKIVESIDLLKDARASLFLPEVPHLTASDSDHEVRVVAGDPLFIARPLSSSCLADGFGRVERYDARVYVVFMNAVCLADLRKWGRDTIDFTTQTELLKQGVHAHLWGAHIVTRRDQPVNEVTIVGMREIPRPEIGKFVKIWYIQKIMCDMGLTDGIQGSTMTITRS